MSSGSEPLLSGQVVLILVGLIGSGKSTFATALEACVPEFRRCNQDDLGDRRSVENLARQTLREGKSVCIDRTNFDAAQRSHWIRIARERPGTEIWVLVFNTPVEECSRRLQFRTNHPTIATPELALSLLSRFHSDFRAPTADEGYDRIYELSVKEQIEIWDVERIMKVVKSLKESPKVETWAGDWGASASLDWGAGDWSVQPPSRGVRGARGMRAVRGVRDASRRGFRGGRGSGSGRGGMIGPVSSAGSQPAPMSTPATVTVADSDAVIRDDLGVD